MASGTVLRTLQERGLAVAADGDALVVGPMELITNDMRAAIRRHKAEILAELMQERASAHWRWWIAPPGRPAFEVRFRPDVTADQVRKLYPGAGLRPLTPLL
jgi:hypothetical protein